jgi:xanthine dehydrogenase YagS FAD-binding subunit
MNAFSYARPADPESAIQALADGRRAAFIAGGTSLVDLMLLGVETPELVVDLNGLRLADVDAGAGVLRIGALARMSDVALHPAVRDGWPAVARALLDSASPQVRNAATIGGNLLQRTRCPYFRDTATPCNKRSNGSGCSAIGGENRKHAILGVSERCIAVHPSDLAVALAAFDATILVRGSRGNRAIPVRDFYVLPDANPEVENTLQPGELITAVEIPASRLAARSIYLKVRDRASFEFALVAVAAAIDVQDGTIRSARLALGGVAPVPWRALGAEAQLEGAAPAADAFDQAAAAALRDAQTTSQNAFKVELARQAIMRALSTAAGAA